MLVEKKRIKRCLICFVCLLSLCGCSKKESSGEQTLSCSLTTAYGNTYEYGAIGTASKISYVFYRLRAHQVDFNLIGEDEVAKLETLRTYFETDYAGFSDLDLSLDGEFVIIYIGYKASVFGGEVASNLFGSRIAELNLEKNGLQTLQELFQEEISASLKCSTQ